MIVVNTAFGLAVNGAVRRRIAATGRKVFSAASVTLLKGGTASLGAFPGGRAVYLYAGQAALVVAIMLAGRYLTF